MSEKEKIDELSSVAARVKELGKELGEKIEKMADRDTAQFCSLFLMSIVVNAEKNVMYVHALSKEEDEESLAASTEAYKCIEEKKQENDSLLLVSFLAKSFEKDDAREIYVATMAAVDEVYSLFRKLALDLLTAASVASIVSP